MGIGGFLRRHSLLAGLLAVIAPLTILVVVQFVWLLRLERAQAIAHAAALDSFLGTVATKVEYFYREMAERTLNVPAGLFLQHDIGKAAYYWKQRPVKGVKRLFLVDLTQTEFGNFLAFDAERGELYSPAASDESLAMVLAANPLHILNQRRHPIAQASLTVDERNTDYRIILNPILDDTGHIVGLAGMILDETYFRAKLLPQLITGTLDKYLPSVPDGALAVTVKDEAGRTALTIGDGQGRGIAARVRLGFVFTDWELELHTPRATPRQWAHAGFAFNATLGALLALALIGGVTFALRAADRAVRLSKMKSDFVSNVSHELRTPVASIRVFGELLRSGRASEPAKVREYGELIEGEGRRLTRLIDNILDFSRIESGRKEYRFAPGDLREVVETVIRTFQMRLDPREFTIRLEAPAAPLPPVRIDADAIAQAFQNLLDNAVKYSGDSKEVVVGLSADDGRVAIAVRDYGIGIAGEEQRKIFERFHRVGTGLVHDVKGSGLGLSIVHHIVAAHGGDIGVVSEPGQGSTFTMRLPALAAEA